MGQKERVRDFLLFLISGVIAAFAQPDRGLFFALAGIVGYGGFFYLLRQLKEKRVRVAFLWALGVFGFQLWWLSTTHYHGVGIIFVYIVALLMFSIPFALLFGLGTSERFSFSKAIGLASLWTIIEWSRLFVLCGFPFSAFGLLLTAHPLTMQMASLIGIYGLSFLVVFASYLFAFGKWKSFVSFSVFFILLNVLHIEYWKNNNQKEPFFHVALVQTGLTVEQKEEMSKEEQWARIFQFLGESGRDQFDLIVLPEVALTGRRFPHLEKAKMLASLYQSEVVIGLVDDDYNAAFHIFPDHDREERYEKRVLVPLSEYLPFSFLRSFLRRYGINSFFQAGKEAKVFSGKVPISVSICYEEGFGHLIREGRNKGAELLVNITNDGWFPSSRLHEEHFNLGKVRAVENGVYVLRACNTGISAVIDPFGNIITFLREKNREGKLNEGVQVASINCFSYPTLFSKFGNTIIISFCLCSIFLIKRKSFSRVLSYVSE